MTDGAPRTAHPDALTVRVVRLLCALGLVAAMIFLGGQAPTVAFDHAVRVAGPEAAQAPTSITMTLDASVYPYGGTPVARLRFTDVGGPSQVWIRFERPDGVEMRLFRQSTERGQTESTMDLPMDGAQTPGDYVAVARFLGSDAWANSESERVPFRVGVISTSVALSTPRMSTGITEDLTVIARVRGSGAATVPVGTVRLLIDGVVPLSTSVDADGRAAFRIDETVRTLMGQSGIPLVGRHTFGASYTFRAGGGYADSTSAVLAHFIGPQAGPVGTVAIYGGAEWTARTDISMSVVASDALEGVASVRIANDPTLDPGGVLRSGETFPYRQTRRWSLETLPCRSCPGERRTVFVQWVDKAGNWSGVSSDDIRLDTHPPSVTGPAMEIDAVPVTPGRVPVRVTWSGTDIQSGVIRYELQIDRDGVGYVAQPLTPVTATVFRTDVASGATVQVRVRAFDAAGRASAWVAGPVVRPALMGERTPGATYAGPWADLAGARYLDGGARTSTITGSEVTFAFAGRGVAWIGARGPDQGVASIYLDGNLVGTVDMASTTVGSPRVAFKWSWKDARGHVLRLVVAGTSSHQALTLDGFAVLRE